MPQVPSHVAPYQDVHPLDCTIAYSMGFQYPSDEYNPFPRSGKRLPDRQISSLQRMASHSQQLLQPQTKTKPRPLVSSPFLTSWTAVSQPVSLIEVRELQPERLLGYNTACEEVADNLVEEAASDMLSSNRCHRECNPLTPSDHADAHWERNSSPAAARSVERENPTQDNLGGSQGIATHRHSEAAVLATCCISTRHVRLCPTLSEYLSSGENAAADSSMRVDILVFEQLHFPCMPPMFRGAHHQARNELDDGESRSVCSTKWTPQVGQWNNQHYRIRGIQMTRFGCLTKMATSLKS